MAPIAWGSTLRCANGQCSTLFDVYENEVINMAPRSVPSWKPGSHEKELAAVESEYRRLCSEPMAGTQNGKAWGHTLEATSGYQAFVTEHAGTVSELLDAPHRRHCIVDISAGSGAYLRSVASNYDVAFHIDAHVPSLLASWRFAQERGLNNIVFIRGSYLSPPLREGSADAIICTDTLERTVEHNRVLLHAIKHCLSPNGVGVIDVHARSWLRERVGNPRVVPITKSELQKMLAAEHFGIQCLRGSGYAPSTRLWAHWKIGIAAAVFRFLRLPARHVALVRKVAEASQ
jgi:SAM-dependent methyltransferase